MSGEPDDAAKTNSSYEELDEKPKSILLGMIKQLRPGVDLSKVTLPTFILEPRSFLEKMTDFLNHSDLFLDIVKQDDPLERITALVRWYVSGWHVKPKGVKKPYNPILGEFFRASWSHPDGSRTDYVAEQVSHHPPISAMNFTNRKAGIVVEGTIVPKSKFLGNSSAAMMEGSAQIHLIPFKEKYVVNFPATYARGIIMGKMLMETVGKIKFSCEQSDYSAELDFKEKGWFGGKYNCVSGKILKGKTEVRKIAGQWDSVVTITEAGKTTTLFSVADSPVSQKTVAPLAEQEPNESRRLWAKVTPAIIARDYDTATKYKTELEDEQRAGKKAREAVGSQWHERFFEPESTSPPLYRYKALNLAPWEEGEKPQEALPRPTNIGEVPKEAEAVPSASPSPQ